MAGFHPADGEAHSTTFRPKPEGRPLVVDAEATDESDLMPDQDKRFSL